MADPHDHDDIDPAHLDELDENGHHPDDAFSSSIEHLGGAGEAIGAAHLERRAKALRKRYESSNAPFLSKAWFKSLKPAPINHVKNNWKTMLMTTVAGGALASAGTAVLSDAPDLVAVGKTALLSYPGYRILNNGFARVGFWTGHFLNAANRDRFREVKTEPAGRWFGRTTAIAAAFTGGVLGHTYLDGVVDLTVKLPSTLTQGVGSAVVDTFTYQSNTAWDPVWETADQASCLYQQGLDPEHICLAGPGSEGVSVSIDPNIISNDNAYGEQTWFGRGMEAAGIDFEIPDVLPTAESVNEWLRPRLGL